MALVTFPLSRGKSLDLQSDPCPSLVRTWHDGTLMLPADGTHYGFVFSGEAMLQRDNSSYPLQAGMYFCLPQSGCVGGASSSGFVVTRLQPSASSQSERTSASPHPAQQGPFVHFSLGGPLAAQGQFSYINGGSDSLLLPPIQKGDPCLNALYFPTGVNQTLHTHPSYRCGLVVSGAGLCHTPEETVTFAPELLFWLSADQPHRFETDQQPLTLVVFHPDSDTGFTHRDHPMLRRTYVDGVSAVDLPELQTPVADIEARLK